MSGYLYSALSFKINCHAELGQPFKLCAQALPSTRKGRDNGSDLSHGSWDHSCRRRALGERLR